MLIEITAQFVKLLLTGKIKNDNVNLAIAKSDEMLLHTEGKGKDKLLDSYRPSEPAWIRKHREDNFRLITKSTIGKIITSLGKINRSDNFTVVFPGNDSLTKQVSEYLTSDYPEYDSFRNWFFKLGLEFMFTEPNGWLVMEPLAWEWDAMESAKPIATLYRAEQAIHWQENNFVFLLLDEKSKLPKDDENAKSGLVYLLATRTAFIKYSQQRDNVNDTDSFLEETLLAHNYGELPAWRMGGNPSSHKNPDIKESFLAPTLPALDEALVQASDKQAAIKQHVYPEAAIYGANVCQRCQGAGRVKEMGLVRNNESFATCPKCKGAGRVVSPFADIIVREHKDNEHPMPDWAPKKYIPKDLEPVKLLIEEVDAQIYKALAAINFEFLADTPLNQSGKAKEIDRQELNTFVYNIADHIVCNIFRPVYWFTFRYFAPKQPIGSLNALQPRITIPKTFDIVTAEVYQAEVEKARTAKMNPRIVGAMEITFSDKQFEYEPELQALMRLTYQLDPFYGSSEDDKMTMMANGGISKSSYIISCNTLSFVQRAMEEDANFDKLPKTKQTEKLREYAAEIDPSIVDDSISIDANGLVKSGIASEIIALQTSYFKGEIAKDAAKSLLTLLFKLSDEDADALLQGEVPKPAPPILPHPNPLDPNPPIVA